LWLDHSVEGLYALLCCPGSSKGKLVHISWAVCDRPLSVICCASHAVGSYSLPVVAMLEFDDSETPVPGVQTHISNRHYYCFLHTAPLTSNEHSFIYCSVQSHTGTSHHSISLPSGCAGEPTRPHCSVFLPNLHKFHPLRVLSDCSRGGISGNLPRARTMDHILGTHVPEKSLPARAHRHLLWPVIPGN
jgi:hypothetical protein